uniref:Uncharacterized protein n=1 Tax=Anguilla anguilla TaxID=7936 RepID=A0A0E9S5G1_ANGAN
MLQTFFFFYLPPSLPFSSVSLYPFVQIRFDWLSRGLCCSSMHSYLDMKRRN